MIWLQRILPAIVLLMPLLLSAAHDARLAAGGKRVARGVEPQLARATLGMLGLHLLVALGLESFLPPSDATRVIWPILISTCGTLLLWLRWARPAIVEESPASDTRGRVGGQHSRRTASLSARHLEDPIGPVAWRVAWLLFALSAALTCWSIYMGAPGVMVLGLGWWIGMGFFASRESLLEAEPRDASDSLELEHAYRSLRAFRSRSFFALGLAGTLAFSVVSVLVLARPDLAGLVGTIVSLAVGLAAALGGVLAGVGRLKVNQLRQALEQGT